MSWNEVIERLFDWATHFEEWRELVDRTSIGDSDDANAYDQRDVRRSRVKSEI